MLSSLLSEVSRNATKKQESPAVLFKLYASLLGDSCMSSKIDLSPLESRLCKLMVNENRNHRIFGFKLATSALKQNHKSVIEGRDMKTSIEKFPTLIEASSSIEENEAIVGLLILLCECQNEIIAAQFEQSIPKIVLITLRLFTKATENVSPVSFGMDILYSLLLSRYRTLLNQNSNSIQTTCISYLASSIYYKKAAKVLSASYAFLKPALWSRRWHQHCTESVNVLREAGFDVPDSPPCADIEIDSSTQGELDVTIVEYADGEYGKVISKGKGSSSSSATTGRTIIVPSSDVGCNRAFRLEQYVSGHWAVLIEMVTHGCASGNVVMPFETFVPVLACISALHPENPYQDPRATICNSHGFSSGHIGLISNQLKAYVVDLVSSIVDAAGGAIATYGHLLVRCMSSLLCSEEVLRSSSLLTRVLSCISKIAKTIPCVLCTQGEALLDVITTLFALEVKLLIKPRTGILSQAGSSSSKPSHGLMAACDSASIGCATTAGPESLYTCIESLLAFCGPFLPVSVRESLELSMGESLACLCKGTIQQNLLSSSLQSRGNVSNPELYRDSRIRRALCEPIREDRNVQELCVRAGLAEIMCCHRDGRMSSNIVLYKRVCQLLLTSTGSLGVEAMKSMTVVGYLLHPPCLPMPSLQLKSSIAAVIKERKSLLEGNETPISDVQDQTEISSEITSLPLSSDTSNTTVSSKKRGFGVFPVNGDDSIPALTGPNSNTTAKREEVDSLNPFSRQTNSIGVSVPESEHPKKKQQVFQSGSGGDSDSDEIPDIVDE